MAPTSITLSVSGMTCGSCVKTVNSVLTKLGSGVEATVNLASGSATVSGPGITFKKAKEATQGSSHRVELN